MNITLEQRNSIVAREKHSTEFYLKLGTTEYKLEQARHLNPPTNEERGSVEVFDFINNPPKSYFLYIKEETAKATNWMGEILGNVSFGKEYVDNFGGKRVPVTVYAINNLKYFGTYFKSGGDYARIKLAKNQ